MGADQVVGVVVAKLDAIKVASAISDIAQNVNFAIKSSVVLSFLDAHGVSYQLANIPAAVLKPADLAEKATSFSVFIECNK